MKAKQDQYFIEKIPISKIKPREGNPNQMTEQDLSELKHSIEKFGFIRPIIIDQNNIIVDGAQRYKAMKELGHKEINAIRIAVTDEKHRALVSQAMNKIQGEHYLQKDIEELKTLLDYDADALYNLIHVDEDVMATMQQQYEEEQQALTKIAEQEGNVPELVDEGSLDEEIDQDQEQGQEQQQQEQQIDKDIVPGRAETYLHGGIKQITLYFSNQRYEELMPKLQKYMEEEKVETNTDLFEIFLELYEQNRKEK